MSSSPSPYHEHEPLGQFTSQHLSASDHGQLKPPTWPSSTIRDDLLTRIPRELRDEIYLLVLTNVSSLVSLAAPPLQYIPPIFRQNFILLPEALEVFYKVNPFILVMDDYPPRPSPMTETMTGTTSVFAQRSHLIRQLVVGCSESVPTTTDAQQYEEAHRSCGARKNWEQLLEMPNLQDLTINMQKRGVQSLNTFDFGPVLHALRTKKSGIKITFNLSFDSVLRDIWHHPLWEGLTLEGLGDYQPMGYVDLSDLISPPSKDDHVYVQEHLRDYWERKETPPNRSIQDGLLDETVGNRRFLAQYYTVKEPALLRCLMAEHFKIYLAHQLD